MLNYRTYQNKNSENNGYGKWYARAVIRESIGIEEIATKMQDNCTVKRADILAVLSELGPTMRDLLQDSKRVVIPYMGAFKLGLKTEGTDTEEEFTAKNVKGIKVLFQPTTRVLANHRRVQDLTENCRVVEYKTEFGKDASNGSNDGNDGGTVVEEPEP